MKRFGWIFAVATLALFGCAQGGPEDTSGGRTTPPPSGSGTGTGSGTGSGSGSSIPDGSGSSADSGTGSVSDAGTPPPVGGGACEPDVIEAPTGVGCMASTRTCAEACTDEACWNGCLDRDPACGACLEDAFLSCVNTAGCQSAWNPLACCGDACADEACFESTCSAEIAAFDACAMMHQESCYAAMDACFGS